MRKVLVISIALFAAAGCTSAARESRARFNAVREPDAALVRALQEMPRSSADVPHSNGTNQASLADVLAGASARSPQLAAAYYRWKAAVDNIGTAVAMPDAMLEYREFIDASDLNIRRMDAMRGVMLTQMITNPGTLAARQRMLAADADVMAEEFEAARREVRRRVIAAYADIQVLDERQRILHELVETTVGLESLMETMVETAMASQADLLRMQIEREEMQSDLAAIDLRRPALLRALEAASGMRLSDTVRLDALEYTPRELPPRAELLVALDSNPMLQMSHAMARAARAKVDEAGWMWAPDFVLGVEWMQMNTPRGMPFTSSVGVIGGVTIPWQFHVNSARTDSAKAAEMSARMVIAQKRLDLSAELELMIYELADARRMIELVSQGTLPKSRQALELVRTDFATGKASLTDVLSTLNSVLAGELTLAGARGMALRAQAAIEAMTGVAFETP